MTSKQILPVSSMLAHYIKIYVNIILCVMVIKPWWITRIWGGVEGISFPGIYLSHLQDHYLSHLQILYNEEPTRKSDSLQPHVKTVQRHTARFSRAPVLPILQVSDGEKKQCHGSVCFLSIPSGKLCPLPVPIPTKFFREQQLHSSC